MLKSKKKIILSAVIFFLIIVSAFYIFKVIQKDNKIAKKYIESANGHIFRTYYNMKDGSWKTDENSYKYRLEITGRMPNAAKDSTFIYLSNIEEISFKQAYLAAGISSYSGDYFDVKDAVLVEMY